MFLALREIRHQPTRFALIVAVITLVAYLTFFLAALASGLAHSYRAAVDSWHAGSVILTTVTDVVGFFAFLGLATVLLL